MAGKAARSCRHFYPSNIRDMNVTKFGLAKRSFTFRDVFAFLVALIWMGKLDSIPQTAMD